MRDQKQFEALLDQVLAGASPRPDAWAPFRDKAAVLITDLSGFTRLTRELGLERMMALIHGMRRTALPLLQDHGGMLVKYVADDLFAAFHSPGEALRCALRLQEALRAPELRLPAQVRLCMGIGYGEVLWWGENDLYGEEVNLASKLGEDTAEADEILLTEAAATAALQQLPEARFEPKPPLSFGGRPYAYFKAVGLG